MNKSNYQAPDMESIIISSEGVICASGSKQGDGQTYEDIEL